MTLCNDRYKIEIVCANKLEDGCYGDIYTSITECRNEHPHDEIIKGFHVINLINTDEETPDWFWTIEEAESWCRCWKGR